MDKLRASEERYRRLFETMSQGVLYHSATGEIISANPAAERILGLSLAEMQERPTLIPGWRIIGEDGTELRDEDYPSLVALRTGQTVENFMMGFIPPQKCSFTWILVSAIPLFHPGECRPYQVYVIFDDITACRQAEQKLREADWKFRALFEKGPIGVAYHEMIYDAQGKPKDYLFLDANENYQKLTGVDPRGKTVTQAFPGIENDQFDWIKAFGHVAKTGESIRVKQYLHLNDSWYDCVAYQYKPDHFVAAFLNITESKRAEEALKERTRELIERSAELERFNYTVSHDLKSPLVTVKAFLGFLEQDLAEGHSERISTDMNFIRSAANRMGLLLDELLKMSRVGQIVNPSEEFRFSALVQEVIGQLAGPIAERGVSIQVNDDGLLLFGDRPRLLEIWQNLIENAIKYMGEQSQPEISVGSENQGNERVFFVRDNGIGIDPRYADKIFNLFEQLDRQSDGSGLGLALVKRIVELNGGRIWAESGGENQGSCFRFTLPAVVGNGMKG